MKRNSKWLVACGLMLGASTAEAAKLGGDASLNVYNNYYFRGAYVFENQANLQPSFTVGWDDPGISLNVWSAMPLVDRRELRDVRDEVDLTLNYDLSLTDALGLSMGVIVYMNPDAEPFFNTEELYLLAAYDLGAGFSVSGGVYGDVNALLGVYATVGAGYSLSIAEPLTLDAGVMLSVMGYKESDFGFVESGATLALTYALTKEVSVVGAGLMNYNVDASELQYALNAGMGYAW